MNRRGREVEESRRESFAAEGKTPVPSIALSRSTRGTPAAEQRRKKEYMRMPLIVGPLSQKFYKATTKGASQESYESAVDLYLETFTEGFSEAYEFVVCIATAKSRQEFIQTYEINAASLYASVVLGLTPEHVCQKLAEFSKMEGVDPKVREFIYATTSSYGKIRLVLMKNQYFLESEDPNVIKYYRDMPNLQDCWKSEIYVTDPSQGASTTADLTPFPRTHTAFDGDQPTKMLLEEPNEALMKFIDLKGDEKGRPPKKYIPIYRLEVHHNKIDKVRIEREGNARYKYMLSQEFDYEDIEESDRLPVTLRPLTKIRPYQEQAIARMFSGNRAKSGIIVLPCGAGKTLVGIMALEKIRMKTLIVCINNLTVKQWYRQLEFFVATDMSRVFKFSSDEAGKKVPDMTEPCIVISTYSMISMNDQLRSQISKSYIDQISAQEWGLLLLDEVQVAPAEVFKNAFLNRTRSHCKLGLTATLIREDNKIEDLQFYLGPKLYEESWIELTKLGYLARVRCEEIRVPMTPKFLEKYEQRSMFGRNMPIYLYTGNPNKFLMLQYLIRYHDARGHKVLVFIDNILILKRYANMLGRPFLCGEVPNNEREKILQFFSHLADWNVLFVSRVGDVGIDLPDANVAIEMSSQFGSRRQETQRLGRILRPKEHSREAQFDSYFYSLVSAGTEEVRYSLKRQKFLIKQGYSFFIQRFADYQRALDKEAAYLRMNTLREQEEFLEDLVREAYTTERGAGSLANIKADDLRLSVVEKKPSTWNIYME